MPSEIMEQRGASSLCLPSPTASSFFSEEFRFPGERRVGFWKSESGSDLSGTAGMSFMSGMNTTGSTMSQWSTSCEDLGLLRAPHASLSVERNTVGLNGALHENGLFSSSLSDVFDRKLILQSNNATLGQSLDAVNSNFGEDNTFKSLEEIEARTIGNLLPDDDDLLSGLGYVAQTSGGDDIDDDIFCTGGGMELEAGESFNGNKTSASAGKRIPNGNQRASLANEQPFGEQPSRTLLVRNIDSNVDDAEVKALFEQYGEIQTLYIACKHEGFVMISYYDIRAAINAMRALQNKPLGRRKLDVHYSIPKDNASDKDISQGTLVVFNLDSSVSNDDIRQIFDVYGEVKEIRETPHKQHHKFIEFYDVRVAEAALHALNRSDIAGKKIKLEPSRPAGAQRRLMQQFSPEFGQEESIEYRHGSSPNSFYGSSGSVSLGGIASNSLDNGVAQGPRSAVQPSSNPFMENVFHGISSSVPHNLSSINVASVGNQSVHGELSHSRGQLGFGFQRMPNFHPHSLPERQDGMSHGIPYNSSTISPIGINSRPAEGIDAKHIHNVGSGSHNRPSFEHNEAFGMLRNGSCPLHGNQYVWNNTNTCHHHPSDPMMWSSSQAFVNNMAAHPQPQIHGLPGAPSHMLTTSLSSPLHHVGSAPTGTPSLWERQLGFARDSADASTFLPGSLGSMGISGNSPVHLLDLASRNIYPHTGGSCIDPAHVGVQSPQRRSHIFHKRNPMVSAFDAPNDRIRSRRSDTSVNQVDNKRQFELDIERIIRGEDSRTTLMIKNIPNKYTSKMLLAVIDEHNQGTYDFIYLPIDFKNKCNVGYAFINMIDPQQIIPFYKAFNGKKWEKFNSEKVASLAYARIQGRAALVAHFQNSSLMNEDKRCRPILFHSDGPNAGDQEPFPTGVNIRSRLGRSRTAGNEENHQSSPVSSPNGDGIPNGPALR